MSATISPATNEALRLLAASIKIQRLQRRWSITDLARRVGVSHPTIISVERADPRVAIGTYLEAATLVGVPLFDVDPVVRDRHRDRLKSELALLPLASRSINVEPDDDF